MENVPSRRDVLVSLATVMRASLEADVAAFRAALDTMADTVTAAFVPASVVVIDAAAYADAVSVVSALREHGDASLLLGVLAELDDIVAVDATRRLALLGALAQLCLDALGALALLTADGNDAGNVPGDGAGPTAQEISDAAGVLLQRLALARQR